ncbi:hypothetical protein YPPY32_3629, partial [Yersinia pestis PY-32]
MAGPSR